MNKSMWACTTVAFLHGDFWENDLLPLNINVKEMWAVAKALEFLLAEVCIGGLRSRELTAVAQRIFTLTTMRNIALSLSYVPLHSNSGDWFSRRLSHKDSMLSPRCWGRRMVTLWTSWLSIVTP